MVWLRRQPFACDSLDPLEPVSMRMRDARAARADPTWVQAACAKIALLLSF